MLPYARHLPFLVLYLAVMGLHLWMWRLLRRLGISRYLTGTALLAASALLTAGLLLGFTRVLLLVPSGSWIPWTRAAAMGWGLFSFPLALSLWTWLRARSFDPSRRRFLRAGAAALSATPLAASGYGAFLERSSIRARVLDLELADLPAGLDGLRIAHLTDIHLGPFLSLRDLERAVALASDFRPHLAVVTGDLISEAGDPLEDCIRTLSSLKTEAGVFGCLGNHEGYVRCEDRAVQLGLRCGLRFLRSQRHTLLFRNIPLNLVGVDHQRMGGPYLPTTKPLLVAGAFNLLLSHNPDVFPVAASQGFDLVLAGHTHGGQINLQIGAIALNVAEFFTPFVYGVFRMSRSVLYVSRGIGCVGIPARFGAPPEVALLRLRSFRPPAG